MAAAKLPRVQCVERCNTATADWLKIKSLPSKSSTVNEYVS